MNKGKMLLKGNRVKFDAIIHGCNCFHDMGGGIAAQIADQFPIAMAVDIMETQKGDKGKLGNFTTALVLSHEHSPFVIINAYTQFQGGADVNYKAIMEVMERINMYFKGKKIAFPAIGAGIAGGDWELISNIIRVGLKDVEATYVEFAPNK